MATPLSKGNFMNCHYCQKEATTKFNGLEVCEGHEKSLRFEKHRFDDENEKEQEDE